MPESRKETAVQVSTGDITVDTTPATTDVQVPIGGQLSGGSSTTIPSGAYYVEIHNTDLENITINGSPLLPGDHRKYQKEFNESTNKVDLVPELVIVVPAGGSGYYFGSRPSA